MKAFDISQTVLQDELRSNKNVKWRRMKGADYLVSNTGLIQNKKGKLLKTKINHCGYECICLYVGGKQHTYRVHRLVAQAFLPNPLNKEQVNHIDGDKLNNKVENLIWSTPIDNVYHSHRYTKHAKRFTLLQLKTAAGPNPDAAVQKFLKKIGQ